MLKIGSEDFNLTLYDSFADVKELWVEFEKTAVTSVYQTYGWSKCWQTIFGEKLKTTPKIIVIATASGDVLGILPLQLRQKNGLSFLEWLGSPDLMHGFGLYATSFIDQAAQWFAANFDKIVKLTGDADVINLANMPEEHHGFQHPLRKYMNVRAANYSYNMDLSADYYSFYKQKRSKGFRKNRLRSDRQILEFSNSYIGPARDKQEEHSALTQMFSDKIEKLGQIGVHNVFDDDQQAFLRALLNEPTCKETIDLELIKVDNKIISVTLGGRSNGCYWYYMTAMTNGPLRILSPGDFLLRWKIQRCCESGLTNFDFGVGDADYKTHWADKKINMWFYVRPLTVRGYLAAHCLKLSIGLKRHIKLSPLLYTAFSHTRKFLLGQQTFADQPIQK